MWAARGPLTRWPPAYCRSCAHSTRIYAAACAGLLPPAAGRLSAGDPAAGRHRSGAPAVRHLLAQPLDAAASRLCRDLCDARLGKFVYDLAPKSRAGGASGSPQSKAGLPYPQKKKNETATAPSRFPKKKEKNRTSCRSCSERSPPSTSGTLPGRPAGRSGILPLAQREISPLRLQYTRKWGLWQGGLGHYAVKVL